MLYVFSGVDREKARDAMNKALAKAGKKLRVVHISDANTVADLSEVLRGKGMFPPEGGPASGGWHAVVLDGVCANEEMRGVLLEALPYLKDSEELFFILEGKLDAETRKKLEKYAETSERFDASARGGSAFGGKKGGEIFSLAFALKRGDKKALWVGYQRALLREEAPEAIHGVLFWGAKDMFLSAKKDPERSRGATLVAELAELPHEARRSGFELEYALEHYILGINK